MNAINHSDLPNVSNLKPLVTLEDLANAPTLSETVGPVYLQSGKSGFRVIYLCDRRSREPKKLAGASVWKDKKSRDKSPALSAA